MTTVLGAGTSTTIIPSSPTTAGTSTLSTGAIVGITIGILLALGLGLAVIVIVLFLVKQRQPTKGKYTKETTVENNKVYGLGRFLLHCVYS